MAFFGNLEGTLRNVFTLGKGGNTVGVRSNSGVLEGQNNGGSWVPLISNLLLTVESRSANFTAAYSTIYLITNAVDVQLPAPVLNGIIILKLVGSDDVNVLRAGSEEIEGVASTYVLTSTKEAATFVSDGTDWFRI